MFIILTYLSYVDVIHVNNIIVKHIIHITSTYVYFNYFK